MLRMVLDAGIDAIDRVLMTAIEAVFYRSNIGQCKGGEFDCISLFSCGLSLERNN